MLLEKSRGIALEKMKRLSQSGNNTQLWMWLVMAVNFWCCKEQYCTGTWNVRSMNQGKFSSVQFCCSVVYNSLWPHELQHTRPPCPSPTPAVYSNSRPSSQWCHQAISSSVVPFSSCPQSLPASESFPMSQLFAWGGQSIGVSALASVLPTNIGGGQTGDGKSEHQHFRNQWTKIDWNGRI